MYINILNWCNIGKNCMKNCNNKNFGRKKPNQNKCIDFWSANRNCLKCFLPQSGTVIVVKFNYDHEHD